MYDKCAGKLSNTFTISRAAVNWHFFTEESFDDKQNRFHYLHFRVYGRHNFILPEPFRFTPFQVPLHAKYLLLYRFANRSCSFSDHEPKASLVWEVKDVAETLCAKYSYCWVLNRMFNQSTFCYDNVKTYLMIN